MNNGLTFGDWLLLWVGLTIFLAVMAYAGGMWQPQDTQQLIGLLHSIQGEAHQTSHGVHTMHSALGEAMNNFNNVMKGQPIIPSSPAQ
jgi:hypothetical protein